MAFFSPLKHGLLLGKYDAPQTFPEGDFRSGIAGFDDGVALLARAWRPLAERGPMGSGWNGPSRMSR